MVQVYSTYNILCDAHGAEPSPCPFLNLLDSCATCGDCPLIPLFQDMMTIMFDGAFYHDPPENGGENPISFQP
jgi:hypothetical protein